MIKRNLLLAMSCSWKFPLLCPINSPSCVLLCSGVNSRLNAPVPTFDSPLPHSSLMNARINTRHFSGTKHHHSCAAHRQHTMVLPAQQGSLTSSPTACKSQPSSKKVPFLWRLKSWSWHCLLHASEEEAFTSNLDEQKIWMTSLYTQEIYITTAVVNLILGRSDIFLYE